MTYSSTVSAPFLMSAPPIAGGFNVGSSDARGGTWFYGSSDAVATVRGAGYFTDGLARGMHRGDVMYVIEGTTTMSINWVTTVTSTGATIAQLTT